MFKKNVKNKFISKMTIAFGSNGVAVFWLLIVGFLGALFIIPTARLALFSVINSLVEKKDNKK